MTDLEQAEAELKAKLAYKTKRSLAIVGVVLYIEFMYGRPKSVLVEPSTTVAVLLCTASSCAEVTVHPYMGMKPKSITNCKPCTTSVATSATSDTLVDAVKFPFVDVWGLSDHCGYGYQSKLVCDSVIIRAGVACMTLGTADIDLDNYADNLSIVAL
ncbi:hypothetical protein GY45DRAFT_1341023 [Cubamyces sp. BRFM 1775]|nr:hypothetical protein GY45DRAFT_1341023 [Cubamyces sp. BRFM 1775]